MTEVAAGNKFSEAAEWKKIPDELKAQMGARELFRRKMAEIKAGSTNDTGEVRSGNPLILSEDAVLRELFKKAYPNPNDYIEETFDGLVTRLGTLGGKASGIPTAKKIEDTLNAPSPKVTLFEILKEISASADKLGRHVEKLESFRDLKAAEAKP